ncbi:MAG: DNA mismatch repair protein MutS [Bacteroidia bacterium]
MTEGTELMRQYQELKARHPDAILLYQVGDFYETFGEDAKKVAELLGIALTNRNNGSSRIELAGFPQHALQNYLPKLTHSGYKIAICNQTEDPQLARREGRVVRREIVEVITPGTVLHEIALAPSQNNYLGIFWSPGATEAVVGFVDVSTGDFFYHKGSLSEAVELIELYKPSEVLISQDQESLYTSLGLEVPYQVLAPWCFSPRESTEIIKKTYNVETLEGLGFEEPYAQYLTGAVLEYLSSLQLSQPAHIRPARKLLQGDNFILDKDSQRNLEVLEPLWAEGTSLYDALNATSTPMGARLLRQWLISPLCSVEAIHKRQEKVALFYQQLEGGDPLSSALTKIGDLQRLLARLSVGRILPRELYRLRESLLAVTELTALGEGPSLQPIHKVLGILARYLMPQKPQEIQLGQGALIAPGVDESLDQARRLLWDTQEVLNQVEEKERTRLDIPSLKIRSNQVFGYYVEISRTHLSKIPSYYLRKQTLKNAERFTFQELLDLEEKIKNAESIVAQREKALYQELLSQLKSFIAPLQEIVTWLAQVDVFLSFAKIARKYNYRRPHLDTQSRIYLENGRHPVLERKMPPYQPYQPNTLSLSAQEKIWLITGPNMAGKSAFLRQSGLLVLMAQIGSFIPADRAEIGVVDQIFTRVGASDNISKGASTFLVEMQEVARITHKATSRSLVLLDEIGRGTSTFDGMALAWAITEYLHNHSLCQPFVLFATHYHELTHLENFLPRLKNYTIWVKEEKDKLIFLHQVIRGASQRSFGIHVAQMAGLPVSIIQRAKEILKKLEGQKDKVGLTSAQATLFTLPQPSEQPIIHKLQQLDLTRITPIEALLHLKELQELASRT